MTGQEPSSTAKIKTDCSANQGGGSTDKKTEDE